MGKLASGDGQSSFDIVPLSPSVVDSSRKRCGGVGRRKRSRRAKSSRSSGAGAGAGATQGQKNGSTIGGVERERSLIDIARAAGPMTLKKDMLTSPAAGSQNSMGSGSSGSSNGLNTNATDSKNSGDSDVHNLWWVGKKKISAD